MIYKVEVDIDACIGCVACTRCENFRMKPDGKVHAITSGTDHLGCNKEVAEQCPVGAIRVTKSESYFQTTK